MLSGYHALRSQVLKLLESRAARNPEAWAAAHAVAPPDADVTLRIVIPLIARSRATDWGRICANLAATLASLDRQTSDAWTVTICGQDRPDGVEFDGEKRRFLPFPIATPRVNSDQKRKLRFLIREAATGAPKDGYIFPLDADDLLHPGFVAHVTGDNNGHGYIVDSGYVISLAQGLIAPAMPPEATGADTTPLYRMCGSTAVMRLDLRRGRDAMVPVLARGKHREVPDRMARFGFGLRPIPFPSVLYHVAHGENLQTIRGYGERKLSYLNRHALPDPAFRDICAAFGLSEAGADASRAVR